MRLAAFCGALLKAAFCLVSGEDLSLHFGRWESQYFFSRIVTTYAFFDVVLAWNVNEIRRHRVLRFVVSWFWSLQASAFWSLSLGVDALQVDGEFGLIGSSNYLGPDGLRLDKFRRSFIPDGEIIKFDHRILSLAFFTSASKSTWTEQVTAQLAPGQPSWSIKRILVWVFEIPFNRVVRFELYATLTALHFLNYKQNYVNDFPSTLSAVDLENLLFSDLLLRLVEDKFYDCGIRASYLSILYVSFPADFVVGYNTGFIFDGIGVPDV